MMDNSTRTLGLIKVHRARLEGLQAIPSTPGRDRVVREIEDEIHELILLTQVWRDAEGVIKKARAK